MIFVDGVQKKNPGSSWCWRSFPVTLPACGGGRNSIGAMRIGYEGGLSASSEGVGESPLTEAFAAAAGFDLSPQGEKVKGAVQLIHFTA